MRGLAPTEASTKDETPYYKAYILNGDKQTNTKKDRKDKRLSTKWVAVRTKYFLMALIPKTVEGRAAVIEGIDEINGQKIQIEYNGDNSWKLMQAQLEMPYDGTQSVTHQFQVYLGPMEYEELKGVGVGLEKMMNFGWTVIKPFSIAFYFTLQFIKGKVGNYGLAIIIFSILIKVVLYPLTRKSFQSMRKMQELQPKIAALKEKFAKEPQKLNQETMKMYKQHGVNPLGGCLPLILQMPVLFALFNLFRTTIMLRQASFIGIQDLSAPDHLLGNINVLPILMGITMLIQQKLTNKDPKQKAMAYFMPIFLTFIFFKLSAGLNLYYFMFNILTIAQELLIKKRE
jgi:YidC/Oxa1 family membrane protein insertase